MRPAPSPNEPGGNDVGEPRAPAGFLRSLPPRERTGYTGCGLFGKTHTPGEGLPRMQDRHSRSTSGSITVLTQKE